METYVADTHAIVWYAENNGRLGKSARQALDKMNDGSAVVWISVMSLMEMDYLAKNRRISPDLPKKLMKASGIENSAFRVAEIGLSVYEHFLKIPVAQVPELPDRVIAATALAHKAKLLTKDGKLRAWRDDLCLW